MKKVLFALVLLSLVWVTAANANTFGASKLVTGAYTVNMTHVGNVYQWDVTLNPNVTGYYGGTIQWAKAFQVFASPEGTWAAGPSTWKWPLQLNNGMAASWKGASPNQYLWAGKTFTFKAIVDGTLDTPLKTVLHVGESENVTYWARADDRDGNPPPTPELSTWLLLATSGVAGAFMVYRRRK